MDYDDGGDNIRIIKNNDNNRNIELKEIVVIKMMIIKVEMGMRVYIENDVC